MTKRLVWSNFDIDIDDWKDFLEECYPDVEDEYDQYNLCCEINDDYLDDERVNLNIELANEIVIIGDLGLWSGRVSGYKELHSNNISNCLYDEDCGFCEWYVDGNKDLRFKGAHHDGYNYYLYREWKDNLSETQKENFLDKLYFGKATRKDISRYTRKIGDRIATVYGWN